MRTDLMSPPQRGSIFQKRAGFLCAFFSLSIFSAAPSWSDPFSISTDIMYDFNSFSGDLFEDQDVVNDQISQLRRLKSSLKYEFNKRIEAKTSIEYDAWKDEFGLDDLYVTVELSDHWEIQIGQFKEPFGMENQQSLSTQYTMERSVPTNAFTFGRNPGVLGAYLRDRWQWRFSATHIQAEDKDYSDSIAYTTRASALPLKIDDGFLHIGAGLTRREASDNKYDIDESLIANGVGNLIGSPKLKLDHLLGSNVELAARYNRVIWQAEYFTQAIAERNGDDHNFYGFYNTLMFTAMGSKRDWDKGEIEFDDSSTHTLEFAIRRSYIDLETEDDGDRAEITTASVNYYYKSAFRMTLEYQVADLLMLDDDEDDEDILVSGNSVNVRLQLTF